MQLGQSWAVLGGESSGKTTFCQDVCQDLAGLGWEVVWVPEGLRTWCEQHQRTPTPSEQYQIAQQQTAKINHHRQRLMNRMKTSPKPWLLLADTTAAQTAAYSEHYFGDDQLWSFAWADLKQFDRIFLTEGRSMPWQPDPLRDGIGHRQQVFALLVQRLKQAKMTTIMLPDDRIQRRSFIYQEAFLC